MQAEYLTFKEAMEYLGMKSPVTLRTYISMGLPVIEIGKSRKISKSAIDNFMHEHQVSNRKE
ncbi:helix-turn-helix domain-containing protein [Lactobacillus taiwanensis]|uniref:helix-turn-helix domain-containing protein n=1 Tax=Lactobacillus taiwanensis TaxID=508451 RepID=UPI0032206EA5